MFREKKGKARSSKGGTSAKRKEAASPKRRIGEMLVEAGLITQDQLDEGLARQKDHGEKLVECLITMGYIDTHAFVRFLAKMPGVASIDLLNCTVTGELLDLVPEELARKHDVFPIDRLGKLLTLGMACPLDGKAIEEIESVSGLQVKPLLCRAQDIQAAIARHYGTGKRAYGDAYNIPEISPVRLRVSAKKAPPEEERTLSRRIRELKSLPVLPRTIERAKHAMQDVTFTVEDSVELVAMDPGVAAKVLGVANSSLYGFQGLVDTIEVAVALLGLRETHSLVLTSPVLDVIDKPEKLDYKSIWMGAMCGAAAAKAVATACGWEELSAVFAAGLLQDIGRLALFQLAPDAYVRLDNDLHGAELMEAETALLGIDHCEAGYELATQWDLPIEISEAVRFHHAPEKAQEAKKTVAAVAVAERATGMSAAPDNEDEQKQWCVALLATLGLDENAAAEVFDEIAAVQGTRFLWARKWESLSGGAKAGEGRDESAWVGS
ncbi:MAG TPA: HDOD domain-containing protein [Candidatus Hydrogenedentes bacterium]|nr:HDOD domain-containing protein [Candidatus Hydrogenedentota bacterium]